VSIDVRDSVDAMVDTCSSVIGFQTWRSFSLES